LQVGLSVAGVLKLVSGSETGVLEEQEQEEEVEEVAVVVAVARLSVATSNFYMTVIIESWQEQPAPRMTETEA
jgi:hypothetical protein